MLTRLIEAENGFNWGKFMLCRFTDEWDLRSAVDNLSILRGRGWSSDHIFVMDLQTGEGAMFLPGGMASSDLEKHKVWVCPMFQPFLEWLYLQDLSDLAKLPAVVKLGPEHSAMYGYRRPGPDFQPESQSAKKRD